MKKLLLVLSFTMFPVLAHGTTYYVAKTGSNSNSCASAQSQTTPKLTINAGVGCLGAGDTLIVRAGTYRERFGDAVPSGTTIQSEVKRGAIIAPGTDTAFNIGSSSAKTNITLDGLVLDGENTVSSYLIHIRGNSSSITVQNMEFKNIKGNGTNNNGGGLMTSFLSTAPNIIIRGNSFHDIGNNDAAGMCTACYPYGIYQSSAGILIEHNEFYKISGFAIHGYSSAGNINNNIYRYNTFRDTGPVLITYHGTGNQFYNNTLWRVGTSAITGNHDAIQSLGAALIANNTIVETTGGGSCMLISQPKNTIRNNICWQGNTTINQQATPNTVDHNLLGQNPLFVNEATGDFHLQNGSLALDAGVGMPGLSFNGSAPDLGAFEAGVSA